MGLDVTVVVATFGDQAWVDLACERAIPSANQLDVPVIHCHRDTLHDARNAGLDQATTEWACFLDADDELEAGYFAAMAEGSADVRGPAVRYVRPAGSAQTPHVPRVAGHQHACIAGCLAQGNWLVVGSLVRTITVRAVDGWWDYPVYEDWSLWLRCHLLGATFEAIPGAVYRAHARPDSRNRGTDRAVKNEAHRRIEADALEWANQRACA